MKMKLDLVLNWTSSKKLYENEGNHRVKNPKNQSQDHIRASIENNRTKIEGSF